MAPNGTVYDDLREVCKLVTEQEEKVRAEPNPCHEAVVAYVRKEDADANLDQQQSLTGPPEQDARGSSLMEQEETSED
ncbi:hypothetical protein QJS10_CPA03g01211 [Acorus calamus]|uniref:Uncharacterized protein n=1 Tax=Acorus calamus TaxID=4465 RepID=A0AAV9FC99_ACOCL|nr:hypothetical protein QJS10_CPA03g01211 [Acorus calamus]